ncbi:MAG: type III pantothenate kinase [Planctomycetes bacterium]|nr:type III pantothenate kinase [Planctomycetota bacterium]
MVTLDLGNSRLKLRRWRVRSGGAPELAGAATFPAGPELVAQAVAELERAAEPAVLALSSVAAPAVEDALVAALDLRFGARFVARPSAPIELAVRFPERVGRDRVFAALGAWSRLGASALVVDAGTCVTVDALAAAASAPRFLGGAIAPGPALLAAALASGGARLTAVEPRPGVPALGRDTEEALRSGIVVGLRGAVRELITEIGREAGLETAPLVWTGGALPLLCEPALFPERRNHVEPELVHLGLLAALGHPAPAVP